MRAHLVLVKCVALALGASSSAVGQSSGCSACALSITRVATIDGTSAELGTFPTLVTSDRSGNLLVLETARIPSVFDRTGAFLRQLARNGKGPGELTYPSWLDAEIDDSIRVLDVDRVVVYNSALRPIRTIIGPTVRLAWHAAFLSAGVYVAQTRVQDSHDVTRTVPLEVRTDSGRILSRIEIPKINGQKVFLEVARKVNDPQGFWLAEWTTKDLLGYRVAAMTVDGKRTQTFEQSRAWWVSADFASEPQAALSSVKAIRQINSRHLAVLIAHPTPRWRGVVVNPRTSEGDRDRYQTYIEVLDGNTGRLLGSALVPGYPLSLLSESRAAIYREAADGTPSVEIVRFSPNSK